MGFCKRGCERRKTQGINKLRCCSLGKAVGKELCSEGLREIRGAVPK